MQPVEAVPLQALLDRGRWTPMQKLSAVLAACAITLDGLDIQILSFAVPSIAKDWHLQKSSFALIFALSLLAVAAGTLVGGWLGDRMGRRKTILLAVTWFGLATLLLATSPSLNALFAYRLISGLGIGAALPNAAAYIAEITPSRYRTTVISATIVCIPLGGLLGGVLAAHILPVASWRMLIAAGGVLPVLLAVVLLMALPESPRFIAAKFVSGDDLLRNLRQFGVSVTNNTLFLPEPSPASTGGIETLLSPEYRRDTLCLWVAFGFCLTSVYLVFNWLPSMLSTIGLGVKDASNGLSVYNLGGIAGALLLGVWMNAAGSRVPILCAAVGSVLSALWLAFHLTSSLAGITTLTLGLGVHGFFVNAVQTALYALAAHMYPTRFRSRGVAVASAFGRAGAIGSAFVGGNALHHGGPAYFFILSGTLACVGISLLYLRNHIPPHSVVVT